MKKAISVLLALSLLLVLAACGSSNPSNGAKTYKIGICNYVDDASLNQIVENIQSSLLAIGEEKGVTFDIIIQNCNADANVLAQIISSFQAEGVDLMVGVATPVAAAMQAATEDSKIPVVFAAVSDPVGSKLVASLDAPGANITGTSDYLDTAAILGEGPDPVPEMLSALRNLEACGVDCVIMPCNTAHYFLPRLQAETEIPFISILEVTAEACAARYPGKTAALLATDGTVRTGLYDRALEARGVTVIERTGTNVDEVVLAAQALIADGAQAVFTPTDNTIMTAELSIYELFAQAGIPHYTGADSFALNGAFLGYGVDYANLGRVTGEMAADILLNAKDPGTVPVRTFDNGTATVNTDTCAALGLDYDAVSQVFAPYCTQVQPIVTAESFSDLG